MAVSGMTASPARVVVIEDDETLQQFFGMVLELLAVEHELCATAEQALQTLASRPASVIVTDLLLPGLDGRGLLRRLQAEPSLRAQARVIVMSGSIDDTVRREMQGLGVWRVLGKPVTVKTFRECISDALKAGPEDAAAPPPPLDEADLAALRDVFDGNEALFRAYRDSSMAQLPKDLVRADEALVQGDPVAMRHLAHNLKGVLRTLGRMELSQRARELEDAAAAGQDAAALRDLWAPLRVGLEHLLKPRS